MIDWDDLRFFLALAQAGSVRSASVKLGVSHSTVARRIEQLEEGIKTKLFDRTPDGYRITTAGTDILESAASIEDQINTIERKMAGQDSKLEGRISVTLPDVVAIYVFMADFADFNKRYPEISLELQISYEIFDLARREADVAFRLLRNDGNPPDHLIGRKLAPIYQACYASHDYFASIDLENDPDSARWIGWSDEDPYPEWVQTGDMPLVPVRGVFPNVMLQIEACRAGLGLAMLPCYVGDNDPDFVRVPPGTAHTRRDIWILSHPDLRDTHRFRVFREFMTERVLAKRELLAGKKYAAP